VTYEEFATEVAGAFDLDTRPLPDARLVEDLGLDSLDCFNLVLLVDELASGSQAADTPYPLIATMADAHHYFQEVRERTGG
jgi:acyl carrier protein